MATATAAADSYCSDASQSQQAEERALWAVEAPSPSADPNSYYAGYETYDYPGSEYYGYNTSGGSEGALQQDWQGDQQAGWLQHWSPESNQQWYDQSQSPSQLSSADYGGAESYDGAAATDYYPEWTPETPVTPDQSSSTGASKGWGEATGYGYSGDGGGGGGGEAGEWAVAGVAETPQEWSSSGPDTAEYGYDAAGGGGSSGLRVGTAGWDEGWATPETAETAETSASDNKDFSASNVLNGGGDGGGGGVRGTSTADMSSTGGNNTAESTPSGGSSSRPWSVNEFGQRVAGDWVEYYDESAQAAYFYNTASGEVSHEKMGHKKAPKHVGIVRT